MIRILSFLLPLVAYFIAEQLWGGLVGLLTSFAITLIVNGIVWLKEGKFYIGDVVSDFLFVLVFGLVDIVVENIDPNAETLATSLALTAILTVTVAVGPKRVLGGMIDKVRPGLTKNPYFLSLMRGSFFRMTLWSAFATCLFLFAFLYDDSAASAWIEQYALIVVLVSYLATEILFSRVKKSKFKGVEWVPLMTPDGTVVGGSPRPLVHDGSHWLHPVVHLHVVSSDGKLILQLRPKTKKIQPGKWDTAVGGHISLGEQLTDALKRETAEEIGLTNFNARLVRKYIWHCDVEDEYVFVFHTSSDGPFNPKNQGEVDELRFWSAQELSDAIGKGILTHNLEKELNEGLIQELQIK